MPGYKAIVVSIVDAPEVELSENETAGEVLLKFYRALGWNGAYFLDPRKVRTTQSVFNKLYELMCEKCPDSLGVGMLMLNSGPGIDEDIPHGKVYLIEGWIIPES